MAQKMTFRKQLIAFFLLIWHGTHRKRLFQQFLTSCTYICYSCTFFTEPLSSNDKRCTYRHRLVRGFSKVCRWCGFRYHDIATKYHKGWFTHSKAQVGWGGILVFNIRAEAQKSGSSPLSVTSLTGESIIVLLFMLATTSQYSKRNKLRTLSELKLTVLLHTTINLTGLHTLSHRQRDDPQYNSP